MAIHAVLVLWWLSSPKLYVRKLLKAHQVETMVMVNPISKILRTLMSTWKLTSLESTPSSIFVFALYLCAYASKLDTYPHKIHKDTSTHIRALGHTHTHTDTHRHTDTRGNVCALSRHFSFWSDFRPGELQSDLQMLGTTPKRVILGASAAAVLALGVHSC